MELKYVGARPIVSQHGVSFNVTQPDSYTFIQASIELLEALSFEDDETKKVHLSNFSGKEYNGRQLADLLKEYCSNAEEMFDAQEEETTKIIKEYTQKVEENPRLTVDERKAWLGNIAIMRDYYLQYTTNENAYKCALHALADKIHAHHIEEVAVTLGRNYALVISHLVPVLIGHKPPYDATVAFIEKDGVPTAILDMNRSKP